jgi:hypothetical protein
VNSQVGIIVTENKHFKDQLTNDMDVNAKELVARELTTFKEQVCSESQANIRANLADVNRSSTDKINELTSRVNRLQDRLSSNSCFQAVRDASEPQAVGEASNSSCPAARASVVATGVNGLNECVDYASDNGARLNTCITHGSVRGGSNAHPSTDTRHQSELRAVRTYNGTAMI